MGGKKKKKKAVYRNYGTYRLPDLVYDITPTGKAKIIFDVSSILKAKIPASSANYQQAARGLQGDAGYEDQYY